MEPVLCLNWGRIENERVWLTIITPCPRFFVSVAAKGVSDPVSLLFATVTGDLASVAFKGVTGQRRL
jgi:hypothetical protein